MALQNTVNKIQPIQIFHLNRFPFPKYCCASGWLNDQYLVTLCAYCMVRYLSKPVKLASCASPIGHCSRWLHFPVMQAWKSIKMINTSPLQLTHSSRLVYILMTPLGGRSRVYVCIFHTIVYPSISLAWGFIHSSQPHLFQQHHRHGTSATLLYFNCK